MVVIQGYHVFMTSIAEMDVLLRQQHATKLKHMKLIVLILRRCQLTSKMRSRAKPPHFASLDLPITTWSRGRGQGEFLLILAAAYQKLYISCHLTYAPLGEGREWNGPLHLSSYGSKTKANIATPLCMALSWSISHILITGVFRWCDSSTVNDDRVTIFSADFGEKWGCVGIVI